MSKKSEAIEDDILLAESIIEETTDKYEECIDILIDNISNNVRQLEILVDLFKSDIRVIENKLEINRQYDIKDERINDKINDLGLKLQNYEHSLHKYDNKKCNIIDDLTDIDIND